MPRMARVVVPGVPHHVTQRGNRREDVFHTDADRQRYLALSVGRPRKPPKKPKEPKKPTTG